MKKLLLVLLLVSGGVFAGEPSYDAESQTVWVVYLKSYHHGDWLKMSQHSTKEKAVKDTLKWSATEFLIKRVPVIITIEE